ncbi:pyridoxal phosphate-dependent transferase [Dendryphion nanum]|uniref:Pyridoxal phosphate-dependent transferase n=1 Tax=Dendryphion nanum TaxID=256645 RepID=A0A9P9E0J6_9PLEO|nr:pyridoxal phosphate-dependent transferase [Dendryphion nanum]
MTSIDKFGLEEKRNGGDADVKFGRELRKEFLFDEGWLNVNHGSFGTYPLPVRNKLRSLQERAESRPDNFIRYEYPHLLDSSRAALATFLNTDASTLVFVPNATTGVNVVLRNLVFQPGEKILYFDNIYGACEKTIEYITETTPAESVKVQYELPVEDDWLVNAFVETVKREEAAGFKVKIAIFDTIVSMPGVRLPFEKLTAACHALSVLSLIDGAHGIGHIPLDLTALNPDFFVSNCHKWLLTPRGSAVFHVPLRNQHLLRSTLPTSHGFIPVPKPGRKIATPLPVVGVKSPWVTAFEFVGTIDSAPYLCVPTALAYRERLGGESRIQSYCHALARAAAHRTASLFGTAVLDNSTQSHTNCCLSNVRLPLDPAAITAFAATQNIEAEEVGLEVRNWISKTLVEEYATFMAVLWYKGDWWVRWSAQVYLELGDFEEAAGRLAVVCGRVGKGEWVGVKSKI